MDNLIGVMQHALGLDHYGRGQAYRNHYCAGPGHHSFDACKKLVADGLMQEHPASALSGGDTVFTVTRSGREHVRDHSPKPPKLTRSQRRYRDYLAADCGLTFSEYLRDYA